MTNIVVWNENVHETRGDEIVLGHYPDGIHTVVAGAASRHALGDADVRHDRDPAGARARADRGASRATDVLFWWGHVAHDQVADEVVERVVRTCTPAWASSCCTPATTRKPFTAADGHDLLAEVAQRRRARARLDDARRSTRSPQGVPHPIVIDRQEMYGEYFDIPRPDEEVFLSTFAGGEVFRSGVAYRRGRGRVFYFSPGDQEYPVYHHPDIQRVLANAAGWAARRSSAAADRGPPPTGLVPERAGVVCPQIIWRDDMPDEQNPSLKDPELYEKLRDDGASKSKAARISNAAAKQGRSTIGEKGGESGSYDDWTVAQLRERAKEIGLTGYSGKRKSELIAMLRDS